MSCVYTELHVYIMYLTYSNGTIYIPDQGWIILLTKGKIVKKRATR